MQFRSNSLLSSTLNMILFCLLLEASLWAVFHCAEEPKFLPTAEDLRVLNETIEKYGPPQDYKQLGLPGPQIEIGQNLHENKFESDERKNYTLRIRAITPKFSYNARYEEGRFEEFPLVKGQFGEHFLGNSSQVYIRTIGYILEEKGFRQFLLDLTAVKEHLQKTPALIISGVPISSTVLITLTGGNTLG
ncbi:uncharacterized protein LOC123013578 isoform X2 [Tribolium madens]|uniref:uncharacterized protein LOC123013578 isoform X2 n=1 Tax=Tribolium madens TaxID=41895 RepID=UPI001CF764AF|nr:uncharacterized protein LOC123013578 isoform X2 [Tribolium madens]